MYNIILIVREIVVVVREILIYMNKNASASPTSLSLFTFCFYIGKNTYNELVRMLYVLLASLNQFHPDFFLVVYHNLGITIDDPRVVCREWEVKDDGGERLLLEAEGCDGNVWVEGSAVRNRWYRLNFNRVHAFKSLYDEYHGECFTWIDLDTIVLSDLSYLNGVDNYFIFHGGEVRNDRRHDVLLGCDGRVLWSVPEAVYIHGSFWKLNLSLYHEVLRIDSLFRENGVRLKYDVQSIFAVMAWGGGGGGGGGGGDVCPFYHGMSRVLDRSMNVIGLNFMPWVMNGLAVWDTINGVGNHVNQESLGNFWWEGSPGVPPPRNDIHVMCDDNRLISTTDHSGLVRKSKTVVLRDCDCDRNEATQRSIFRMSIYPDKEIHILSLTFDSFFMSNVYGSSDFTRLFPFLLV